MPNVVGRNLEQAQNALRPTGATVTVQRVNVNAPANEVVGQTPPAGTPVRAGGPIALQVATGQLEVPDVEGQREAEAQGLLIRSGFKVPTIRREPHQRIPQGSAIRTEPPAGRVLDQGAEVNLFISSGRP